MNCISLCLFMAIKFVYFVLCHLGWGRVWTWVYDPPTTFTILSGRWVGNTGCPAKSSSKGGHPIYRSTLWLNSKNGGSTFLQNVGIKSEYYTTQQLTRPHLNPHHSENLRSSIIWPIRLFLHFSFYKLRCACQDVENHVFSRGWN
jgi:hypothetical protein